MKKNSLVVLLIFGVIVVIAMLTNPNQQQHKDAVKSKLNVYMQKSLKSNANKANNRWEEMGQNLGAMFGGVLVEQTINNLVSSDNFILFSLTNMTWEGESKTIGFGFMGNVFLSSKIDEALKNSL